MRRRALSSRGGESIVLVVVLVALSEKACRNNTNTSGSAARFCLEKKEKKVEIRARNVHVYVGKVDREKKYKVVQRCQANNSTWRRDGEQDR